jgi:L-rhamnose mutarotase
MKRLIILILLSFGAKAYGQVYQIMPQYGYDAKRMKFDSTLQIPTVCGVPTLKSNVLKYAAIAYDSCNKRLYYYDPKLAVWDTIKGGSGGGSTDTTSLSNRINQKVPYTGATADVDLDIYNLSAHELRVTGTNGQGKLDLRKQSPSDATTSANSSALFADANGNFSWRNDNIASFKFLNQYFTGNRTYHLPDSSGAFALLSNVNTKLNISDTSVFLRDSDSALYQTKYRSDTSRVNTYTSLATKLTGADTVSLSNRINAIPIVDTTSLSNRINAIDLQSVTDNGDTTTNNIYANSYYLYDAPEDRYGNISLTDNVMEFTNNGSTLFNLQQGLFGVYNNSNVASFQVSNITGSRTYTFPDSTGTIALLSNVNTKLNISDTSVFLRDSDSSLYQTKFRTDTMRVNVYNAIASSGGSTDTTSLSNRINTKLNISDTSVFLRDSFPSYTFYANNTTAKAPALPNTFKDTSGAFTGSLTWTGTTAPSGATDHTFRYTQIGRMVSVSITLVYGSAGSTLTAVQMELPSYFPTPVTPSGLSGNSSILYMGSAHMSNGLTVSANIHRGHLRTNSTNTGYEFFIQTATAGNYRYAELNIFYFIP